MTFVLKIVQSQIRLKSREIDITPESSAYLIELTGLLLIKT